MWDRKPCVSLACPLVSWEWFSYCIDHLLYVPCLAWTACCPMVFLASPALAFLGRVYILMNCASSESFYTVGPSGSSCHSHCTLHTKGWAFTVVVWASALPTGLLGKVFLKRLRQSICLKQRIGVVNRNSQVSLLVHLTFIASPWPWPLQSFYHMWAPQPWHYEQTF